jgi:hypothetical protein
MNKFLWLVILLLYSNNFLAQNIEFNKTKLIPVNVSMSLSEIDSNKVVRVIKNSAVKEVDAPTFVRLNDIDFKNGVIEVKVLSRLLPDAGDTARGFIGITFHINDDNTKFEGIYLRPTNGRAVQQIRRNHSIQYFSYPNFKYDILRKIAPGQYESYADMDLNEWIKMKVVVKDAQAKLFLNGNNQPSLIVNDLKNGPNNNGVIGLFVDIGTEGFFSDLKVVKEN